MRLILPVLLLALGCAPAASAQTSPKPTAQPQMGVISFISQRVGVRAYAGKPFRYSARMRADTLQSGGADAGLVVVALGGKRWLNTLPDEPLHIRSKEWQTYTVSGKLPAKVDTLVLNASHYLNGTFEYDDFRLEVETRPGQWQTLPLRNADFEQAGAADGVPSGWLCAMPTLGFSYATVATAPGQHALRVTGRGMTHYGLNPHAGRYATVNGVRLYYETYGQGEPLLLLHGNGESIGGFTQQIGALAAHYRVIAVDTRGHGKSAADRRAYTYDLFADDMRALLDTLGIRQAHVLGWSDGGNTGLSLALRYPARVKSLVTMGANLYYDKTAVDTKTRHDVQRMRVLSTVLAPFNANFRRARRLVTLLAKYPRMQPAQLAAIKAPTLVLAGEKDLILEPHTRLIGRSIPGARVLILPGLSHYAPREDPAAFNQAVLSFLRALPPIGG